MDRLPVTSHVLFVQFVGKVKLHTYWKCRPFDLIIFCACD